MASKTCPKTYYQEIETPCHIPKERYRFVPHPHHDANIYGNEPQIARESVEHTTHECLLTRKTGQLSVGGVTEVGEHQQHNSPYIRLKVRVMEHPSCSHSKEYRQYSDGVGMHSQLLPHQCESQTDWSGKMHVKPFFRIFRLERCLQ